MVINQELINGVTNLIGVMHYSGANTFVITESAHDGFDIKLSDFVRPCTVQDFTTLGKRVRLHNKTALQRH